MMEFELDLYTSAGIIVGFSLLIVILDEFVAKPWREKKWKKQAANGDPEAQELLRIASSAMVHED